MGLPHFYETLGSELVSVVWFETDRDLNAAANVLKRGLEALGVGHSEGTPAETATAVSTDGEDISVVVDASGVVESGSPVLKETIFAVE